MSKPTTVGSVGQAIRYLSACHEADQRAASFFDLFHRSVSRRFVFSGEELVVSRVMDVVALPADIAEDLTKQVAVYRRERRLVYTAIFLVGRTTDPNGKPRRLCAPIFIADAAIEGSASGLPRLRIDLASAQLNVAVLEELSRDSFGRGAFEAIVRRFPDRCDDVSSVSDLSDRLRQLLPHAHTDELFEFPKLVSEEYLIRTRQRLASPSDGGAGGGDEIHVLAGAAVALVTQSKTSRGSLFELDEIAGADRFSPPLDSLFGSQSAGEVNDDPDGTVDLAAVPVRLSEPQEKVLRSAAENVLSLIVGPPGTGKSFTIAALAVEQVCRGNSVLIACRNDQALDVVSDKIDSMLGGAALVLRGGSSKSHRALKKYLGRLLGGELDHELKNRSPPGPLRRELKRIRRELGQLERLFEERITREVRYGELSHRQRVDSLQWWERIELVWLKWRIRTAKKSWVIEDRLRELDERRIDIARRFLRASMTKRLRFAMSNHRRQMSRFARAIRARTSSRQEKYFDSIDFQILLSSFPVWMTTFSDLHRAVPLRRELFDMVVVDEATQCDMASPIPALFRARRAVLTGDPKQLAHVSFLSRARQTSLAEEVGIDRDEARELDYRDKSLLHRVDERLASQSQVGFLDEHFRSMPQIIRFSNREFYGGRLRIMTSRPETNAVQAVELVEVDGQRDEDGVNELEANTVIEAVVRLIERQSTHPQELAASIGVLSPFRPQTDFLSERLLAELGTESIDRHRLLVGTAHSFQGDERDVMFVSLAVDANSHPASLRYLNQEDLFNVSVTRARERQLVFCCLPRERWDARTVLGRFLADALKGVDTDSPPSESYDRFVVDVADAFRELGFRVWSRFAIAGQLVDLLVERRHCSMGIDLVGYVSATDPTVERAVELERIRSFSRAGLMVLSLGYFDWERSRQRCLEAMTARFDDLVVRVKTARSHADGPSRNGVFDSE